MNYIKPVMNCIDVKDVDVAFAYMNYSIQFNATAVILIRQQPTHGRRMTAEEIVCTKKSRIFSMKLPEVIVLDWKSAYKIYL